MGTYGKDIEFYQVSSAPSVSLSTTFGYYPNFLYFPSSTTTERHQKPRRLHII